MYWQDIDSDIIDAFELCYSNVTFIKTYFSMYGAMSQRIPSKMYMWQHAVDLHHTPICLIDCDTIIVKSPAKFFDLDADIIFTDKNEQFYINTGVMLVRPSPAVRNFFSQWTDRTIEIVNDPKLLNTAISSENHYGAADQMAFYEIIQYTQSKKGYIVNIPGFKIKLQAIDCNILNQTNSVKLNDSIFIYHYKGGWRDILSKGIFHDARPQYDSTPMLLQFLSYYTEAIRHLKNNGIKHSTLYKIQCHDFSKHILRVVFFFKTLKQVVGKFLYD
jgi:hypothetical protein